MGSDLTRLAGHPSTILGFKGTSLSNLLCEVTRCCLLAMNEHDGFEVLKWDAFTLIKLPRLFSLLLSICSKRNPSSPGGEAAYVQRWLQRVSGGVCESIPEQSSSL